MFELIMITALFLQDNEEFFEAGPANAAAGLTWQYVGSQPVPEGHVAIPSVNPDTGKETVIFVRK
jgi:hypothetical protein